MKSFIIIFLTLVGLSQQSFAQNLSLSTFYQDSGRPWNVVLEGTDSELFIGFNSTDYYGLIFNGKEIDVEGYCSLWFVCNINSDGSWRNIEARVNNSKTRKFNEGKAKTDKLVEQYQKAANSIRDGQPKLFGDYENRYRQAKDDQVFYQKKKNEVVAVQSVSNSTIADENADLQSTIDSNRSTRVDSRDSQASKNATKNTQDIAANLFIQLGSINGLEGNSLNSTDEFLDHINQKIINNPKGQLEDSIRKILAERSRRFFEMYKKSLEKGSLSDAQAALNEAINNGNRAANLDEITSDDWQMVAEMMLACGDEPVFDGTKVGMNLRRSGAYAEMYRQNPEAFVWSGLAAFASDTAGLGIKVGQYADKLGIGETFLFREMSELLNKGNKKIFDDIYWQHMAYQEGGIDELYRLNLKGNLDTESYQAWELIDEGIKTNNPDLVRRGSELFAQIEQLGVIQPVYDEHRTIAWLIGIVAFSPVPGHISPFQFNVFRGDLGNGDDRWKWTQTILRDWESVVKNDPGIVASKHQSIIDNAKGACQ